MHNQAINAAALIAAYNMLPHPEGGFYKETYRSFETVDKAALPARFKGDRSFSTAIYFLLQQENFSAFHRIQSDECWHFYAGDCLLIHVIDVNGQLTTTRLGCSVLNGELFQFVVPAGCWFASEPAAESSFCFVGCTVSPGFDFEDFELAGRNKLVTQYPQHAAIINRLTRV
ncbi:cupin domain-containing protein [Panacibacter sp. DH6]|uniref:Cupin domain-containing protein n=1 Tax=Panacibacter microcysteis TaxID=2793269 RepID=A0A931E5M0_9BACT|nr:cupin domain-containing protein [Panacibacter microcysteis]MBG9374829.1 cupin domain-containing protein [Panacibacter microcysteis]